MLEALKADRNTSRRVIFRFSGVTFAYLLLRSIASPSAMVFGIPAYPERMQL